jgi:hypothetical protein
VKESVPAAGFETRVELTHSYLYVAVHALAPGNRVLAGSGAVAATG